MRRGFVLVTTAICLVGLLAVVGLVTDLGRLYVCRNELQVFVDEAAIAAAFELDGTDSGVVRARNTAVGGPGAGAQANRWNFGTETVSDVRSAFATQPAGPFDSNPASAAGLRFVQVRAAASVKLYFLPLVPGIASAQAISASAAAGQSRVDTLAEGAAPFSPDAHDPTAADYGFTPGEVYTLRWAPAGQRTATTGMCAGDFNFTPGASSDRGYIDVGQGSGADAVRNAVVNSSFYLPAPLTIGTTLSILSGQESVPSALEERFAQDTDVTATTYSTYAGNGRRLLTVAVNDGAATAHVIGFALFFLPPTPCGTKNTTPCCAEYVGPAVLSGSRKGAGADGLYKVQLVE